MARLLWCAASDLRFLFFYFFSKSWTIGGKSLLRLLLEWALLLTNFCFFQSTNIFSSSWAFKTFASSAAASSTLDWRGWGWGHWCSFSEKSVWSECQWSKWTMTLESSRSICQSQDLQILQIEKESLISTRRCKTNSQQKWDWTFETYATSSDFYASLFHMVGHRVWK